MKPKAVTTRRLFFWKAGAALSAPLAVASTHGSGGLAENTGSEALKARLELLEDVNAIRELNRVYAKHVNAGAHEKAARLFADAADAPVDHGIRSVSAEHFEQQDVIEISADHKTATARVRCIAQIETPIEPVCPLVEMAQQQGGGVVKRAESGVFENAYVKRNGAWKLERSVYRRA